MPRDGPRTAWPPVHNGDQEILVGGEQHGHLRTGRILGRVADGLAGKEVPNRQHRLRKLRERVGSNDPDPVGRGRRHLLQRRREPLLPEQLRMDTADRPAQRPQALLNGGVGLGQELRCDGVVLDRWGELRLPHLHGGSHEVLLGAVVEIAFDATALHLVGLDDDTPRSGELGDPLGGLLLMADPPFPSPTHDKNLSRAPANPTFKG